MKKRSSSTIQQPNDTILLTNNDGIVTMVARQLDHLITDYFGDAAVQEIIPYYRVSTAKRGRSGLGLDGQQAAVSAFVVQRGCEVLATYQEVESGKNAERPELARAVAHAKRSRATLVVAKLDRLASNVAFLSRLMESGVDFVAIDLEHANRLTIHILSAVAEGEAKAISDRTKAALAAAKVRGTKLGSARLGHWEGREDARAEGQKKAVAIAAAVNRQSAAEAYVDLLPVMRQYQAEGKSLRAIAEALNKSGHTTRRGKPWNQVQVGRVLSRADSVASK
jgi:DNA invertase Pin-like site-specific DNA recombinase